MGIATATGAFYAKRPKWPVAHHLSANGVPSPFRDTAIHQLSKQHRLTRLAVSIVFGIMFAAIYFAFLQAQQQVQNLRNITEPWAQAAIEAKAQEEAAKNSGQIPVQANDARASGP